MLFPAMACGQTKPNDMDDKKQIENLYKQMYQAMITKDIAALDTILAEGSVLIHMTGTRQDLTRQNVWSAFVPPKGNLTSPHS